MRGRREIGGRPAHFPNTRLSAVLAVRSADPAERSRALEVLAAGYWQPVYGYLRLHWRCDSEDAQDLTQAFFARALEKDFFAGHDAAKGTFRTFLRTCLDRFVANERKAAARLKRGGGVKIVHVDFARAESELGRAEPRAAADVDAWFHREWVRTLFAAAVEALRDGCERDGRSHHFELFRRYDLAPDGPRRPTYAELAAAFALPVSQVTNRLAQIRRDFRRIVLERLREMTGSDAEFEAEAQALFGREI